MSEIDAVYHATAGEGVEVHILDLDWILDTVVDERWKSWPPQLPPTRIRDIAAKELNLYRGDLPTPVAILRRDALRRNSAWMRHFLSHTGAVICPHGKTTMAPQLFDSQLRDGAWGITVATRQQFAVARRAGVRRMILANELVTDFDMQRVVSDLDESPELEVFLYVDSVPLVKRWSSARRLAPGRPIRLLLEVGYMGGRTGARTIAEAIEIAGAIRNDPNLELRGIAGFEGLMREDENRPPVGRIRTFLDQMREVAQTCTQRGLFADGSILLTAGGSAYYDLVADVLSGNPSGRPMQVVLRSGCYLTQDHDLYTHYFEEIAKRAPKIAAGIAPPVPALEVWGAVQSRPEPERAVCAIGKRDISFDVHLPRPIAWCRPGSGATPRVLASHTVGELNDQHALLRFPEDSPLRVGDLVGFGVSHPCTTFDRWPLLYIVDEQGTVVDAVRTYF